MLWWTLRQLKSKDWRKRQRAVVKLGESQDAEVVGLLKDALRDEAYQVRLAAVAALALIGNDAAMNELAWTAAHPPFTRGSRYSDADEVTARKAMEIIVKAGDERAQKAMKEALVHSSSSVRMQALYLLSQVQDPWVINLLISVLGPRHFENETAGQALLRFGQQAFKPLIEVLTGRRSGNIAEVAKLLAKLGDQRAIEPLVSLLSNKHGALRPVVAQALEALGWHPVDDEQRLQYALAREDWDELAKLGEPAAVLLTAALDDSNDERREKVIKVLKRLGAPAIKPLLAALNHENYWVWDSAGPLLSYILRTHRAEIPEADLRAVAALKKGILTYHYEDSVD